MEEYRPGGEFGQKCPHCGHYNRFSVRMKFLLEHRVKGDKAKRICSKCGKDFNKEYTKPDVIQTSLSSDT